MHLYIMTRGIKHEVDRLINDLQAVYLPFSMNGQATNLQLSVRPIQLWEIVMPESQLPVVMNTLWPTNSVNLWDDLSWKYKIPLTSMRMALGAEKIPNLDKSKGARLVYNQNVAIYPIGIKADEMDPVKNERI